MLQSHYLPYQIESLILVHTDFWLKRAAKRRVPSSGYVVLAVYHRNNNYTKFLGDTAFIKRLFFAFVFVSKLGELRPRSAHGIDVKNVARLEVSFRERTCWLKQN